ncbi:MAG: hypothetical protein WDM89_07800 [Rhizomicrobium sp.]
MWRRLLQVLFAGLLFATAAASARGAEQPRSSSNAPGPSAALFAHPYYKCVTNDYVATNGSDSNDGASPASPWLTLQHANDALPSGGAAAGTCINVAPGTYTGGVALTTGGAHASSKGYVVYRCTELDACTIAAAGWTTGAFDATGTDEGAVHPAYLIFDGFTIVSPQPYQYSVAISCWAGNVAHIGDLPSLDDAQQHHQRIWRGRHRSG